MPAETDIAPPVEKGRDLHWPKGGDPVSQASLWVPERLYKWQVDLLNDFRTPGTRGACVTPNESGKTSVVIPTLGLSFMAAFPGSQVVSTSGVERQIKEQLWPVLRAALSRWPQWQITEELKIKAPPVRGLPGSSWDAFTTRDPNYAEGFHGRWYRDADGNKTYAPLLVIIDEAKSFSDYELIHAFERCDPDMWLMVSTPGEDTGPFFDAFNSRRGKPWKCHEVTWADCPHLMTGRKLLIRQQKIEELGPENPFVLSWVFGKFFRKGGRLVFDRMQDIDGAMSGLAPWIRGERFAAMDFSGGGDEQVFAVRDGNSVQDMVAFRMADTTKVGDEFIRLSKRWGVTPENAIADNGGLGKPIIDYMESKGFSGMRRYMANAKPKDSTLFVDRSAEDHFELRNLLQQGVVQLPNDAVLKDQMRRRRYEMRNDDSNRIRLEPKEHIRKRGEHSPDRLDTIAMLFADMPVPKIGGFDRLGSSLCGAASECFKPQNEDVESVFAFNRFDD